MYKVVDVFTERPLLGNPVAVVLDADGLDAAAMQSIARWTNLSETTFLLPPTAAAADYRVRIFTPRNELPFAGHPTLGTAYAALEAGRAVPRAGRLVQECAVGLVQLEVEGRPARRVTLTLPPATVTPLGGADIDELEAVLRHAVVREAPPAMIDVGPIWIVAQLASGEQVVALQPDFARSAALERRLGATGISVFGARHDGHADIEVRSFAPSSGVEEDPVCGSGNGSVAVFRRARGLLNPAGAAYTAAQGQCVGRDGRVTVNVACDGEVRLGGACITCVDGALSC